MVRLRISTKLSGIPAKARHGAGSCLQRTFLKQLVQYSLAKFAADKAESFGRLQSLEEEVCGCMR